MQIETLKKSHSKQNKNTVYWNFFQQHFGKRHFVWWRLFHKIFGQLIPHLVDLLFLRIRFIENNSTLIDKDIFQRTWDSNKSRNITIEGIINLLYLQVEQSSPDFFLFPGKKFVVRVRFKNQFYIMFLH